MSRRHQAKKRVIQADPKYQRMDIAKFCNTLMESGKKDLAWGILYGSLDQVAKITQEDSLEIFDKAIANIIPELEVKSRRVGGGTYQIPIPVTQTRGLALAFRWLHQFSKKRSEKTMQERLAKEIIEASENRGNTVKKKQDTHKMAESNRAFAHYRW